MEKNKLSDVEFFEQKFNFWLYNFYIGLNVKFMSSPSQL